MRSTARRFVVCSALAAGLAAAGAAPAWALAVPAAPDPPDLLSGRDLPAPVSICGNTVQVGDSTMQAPCVRPDPDLGSLPHP